MFKIYLSSPAYQKIISSVENKAATQHSHLYRLLKQQPVQILTPSDVEKYKTHPENVLKNPSSLYILDITPSEASNIQESYGIMCLSTGHLDVSPLIDVNDIHTADTDGRGIIDGTFKYSTCWCSINTVIKKRYYLIMTIKPNGTR